jgi:hypothetical protein
MTTADQYSHEESVTGLEAPVITPASSSAVSADLAERIDPAGRRVIARMHARDMGMAFAFLALLWVAYGIVSVAIRAVILDQPAYIFFLVCIGVIVLYNTFSIGAMVLNMRRDRTFIYMRDLMNLRAKSDARGTEKEIANAGPRVQTGMTLEPPAEA